MKVALFRPARARASRAEVQDLLVAFPNKATVMRKYWQRAQAYTALLASISGLQRRRSSKKAKLEVTGDDGATPQGSQHGDDWAEEGVLHAPPRTRPTTARESAHATLQS